MSQSFFYILYLYLMTSAESLTAIVEKVRHRYCFWSLPYWWNQSVFWLLMALLSVSILPVWAVPPELFRAAAGRMVLYWIKAGDHFNAHKLHWVLLQEIGRWNIPRPFCFFGGGCWDVIDSIIQHSMKILRRHSSSGSVVTNLFDIFFSIERNENHFLFCFDY